MDEARRRFTPKKTWVLSLGSGLNSNPNPKAQNHQTQNSNPNPKAQKNQVQTLKPHPKKGTKHKNFWV